MATHDCKFKAVGVQAIWQPNWLNHSLFHEHWKFRGLSDTTCCVMTKVRDERVSIPVAISHKLVTPVDVDDSVLWRLRSQLLWIDAIAILHRDSNEGNNQELARAGASHWHLAAAPQREWDHLKEEISYVSRDL